MARQELKSQLEADKGRKGDTVLAHLTDGEMVIPKQLAELPEFQEIIRGMFQESGTPIEQFIVGNDANSINPETGNPEFGFLSSFNPFKIVKKIFKAVSSFLTPKIPTIPTAPAGPSVADIRAQEEAKIKAEALTAIRGQEEKRRTLRGRLLASEDEDEDNVRRKRLFGE